MFHFICLPPQCCFFSSDFFNILTNPKIRGKAGYYKDVDDILTTAKNISELEIRLKNLLSICRAKNMKLAPSKFQIGSRWVMEGWCWRLQSREGMLEDPSIFHLQQ